MRQILIIIPLILIVFLMGFSIILYNNTKTSHNSSDAIIVNENFKKQFLDNLDEDIHHNDLEKTTVQNNTSTYVIQVSDAINFDKP